MILAIAILEFALWMRLSAPSQLDAATQSAAQTASAPNNDSQNQQPQNQTPGANSSPANSNAQNAPSKDTQSQDTSTGQPKPAVRKPIHKKKVAAADCVKASSGGSATSASKASTGNSPAQNSGSSSAPKICPPEKIIVQQGGTSEPSIQLAGGPGGDDASQKRDATNQMLSATEGNLKNVAGQPLTASQKDSVTQIRQFMEESKRALAAGDVESARTLAWKAKLLSDDLVKPPE
jgi:hypothetical protein